MKAKWPGVSRKVSGPMVTRCSPSTVKSTELTPVSVSGRTLPPPGSTSMMYCEKVSAKPVIGRAMIQARVRSQNGKPG